MLINFLIDCNKVKDRETIFKIRLVDITKN